MKNYYIGIVLGAVFLAKTQYMFIHQSNEDKVETGIKHKRENIYFTTFIATHSGKDYDALRKKPKSIALIF